MAGDNALAAIEGITSGLQNTSNLFIQDVLARKRKQQDLQDELSLYQAKQPLVNAEKQKESDMMLGREKQLKQYESTLKPQTAPVYMDSELQKMTPEQRAALPVSMTHINDTAGTDKADKRKSDRVTKLGEALDPSKQRTGAFGVSKQVFDRAERLESLASALPDGNLDSRQIEELAIGLNSMLSGSNTGAQEQVKSLVPHSVMGSAKKLQEWITNNPTGLNQQKFVNRMLGSIAREKATASDQMNRTQFQRIGEYPDVEKDSPNEFNNALRSNGVDPNKYSEWKKGGYKPLSAVQVPEVPLSNGGGASGWSPAEETRLQELMKMQMPKKVIP